jgi:hypothetical protein
LFNFDGTELDSGTVAEFMAARFIDLPCVVLRSDFRKAGDQNIDGEAWNLMLSGYPGTVTLSFDSMNEYQRAFRGKETFEALKCFYTEMAEKIVAAYGTTLGECEVVEFSNCESQPHFIESIGGCTVFIIQSTFP